MMRGGTEMRGCSVSKFGKSPYRWRASCSLCFMGCEGEGFCPGDALSLLPCKAERRLEIAGKKLPEWREKVRRACYEILV